MARRVKAQPAPKPSTAATAELPVMRPDFEITIAGRTLTVREYEFFEGLEVAHRAEAFINDMAACASEGELRYDRIRRLLGVHRVVVQSIAAQAAGVDESWLAALSNADKDMLMSTWFAVNSGFFVHEAVVTLREWRTLGRALDGPTSSPLSPPPASAGPTASADTPNVS